MVARWNLLVLTNHFPLPKDTASAIWEKLVARQMLGDPQVCLMGLRLLTRQVFAADADKKQETWSMA